MVEKLEPLFAVDGTVTCTAAVENSVEVTQEITSRTTD